MSPYLFNITYGPIITAILCMVLTNIFMLGMSSYAFRRR
jgi:hypothetical protein